MRVRSVMGAVVVFGATITGAAGASLAQPAEGNGDAYGHYTNISLFGGPEVAVGPVPSVTLPPAGATEPVTATEDSGAAIYGPATVFGGIWTDSATAPRSGPIRVSTIGKPGPGGFVTSTADIGLHPTPVPVQCSGEPTGTKNCTAPGGFGPLPVTSGDEMHSSCTANEEGAKGSVRLVNAQLAVSTDSGGSPTGIEPVPEFPPPNYTREGEITNVGGRWKIIFNEQIVEPDGSITVNGYHMFLLSVAVGDQIVGHVRCSMQGIGSSSKEKTDVLPFLLGAGGVAAVVAGLLVVGNRRRRRQAVTGVGPD